jgi:hypothetical protein
MNIGKSIMIAGVLALVGAVFWWVFSETSPDAPGVRPVQAPRIAGIHENDAESSGSNTRVASGRRRSPERSDAQEVIFSTETSREHLFRQVKRRAIPWSELEALIEDLSQKWPKDHFRNLIVAIGSSDLYSVEEKSGLLKKYYPLVEGQGSGYSRSAVLNSYIRANDMVGARQLVEAMDDEPPGGSMASAYYIHRCTDLTNFMQVVTSDVTKEHPLLGSDSYWAAVKLASIGVGMVDHGRTTEGELLQAVENADLDDEFKRQLLKKIHSGFGRKVDP